MRKLLAATVVSAVGLVLGGGMIPSAASAHDTTSSSGYPPPSINWGKCTDPGLVSAGAQCGFLTVPLDYAHPGGRKIELAVSRVRHTSSAADYQGVMVTNPGGPGGSGLTLSTLGSYVPDAVGGDYDWIGFDPRGVGDSVPSLSCDTGYFGYDRPYYVPVTPALQKTWLARSKGYAQACDRAGGALLDHVKTTDTVADMESIRKALGVRQINYYGFSYGTYLGQVYATLHPGQVRRMILDSNVDPRGVWYQANLDQDVQFDKNMDTYFAWVAQNDAVYHLGKTGKVVKAKYYAELQALRKAPVDGQIGPDEWNDVFVSAGYYVYGWADLAAAFAAFINDHDPSGIEAQYAPPGTPGADNGFAMYLATQCTDVKWPTSWAKWQRDNWRLYAKYPFLTWNNVWYNAPCIYWGARPGTPVTVNGAKAPPVLLIDETNDAATPYTGSLYIRKIFPRSVLVEGVGGTTHAGSLSGVACTDNTVAAYLATGALPGRVHGNRSDKQCPPVPPPSASASAARTLAVQGSSRSRLTVTFR